MSRSLPLSTEIREGASPTLEVEAAELRVVAGPDRGLCVPLEIHSMRIGSQADCDLVLHDPAVSGRHAEISVTPSGYVVRDRGSKNGICLDAWRIREAVLADGMRLRLGDTTLKVRALGLRRQIELGQARRLGRLVAHSVEMRAVASTLEQLALSDICVLIEGETGTGKEVAAQALHGASPRSNGPFVVFDCGATAPSLLAAELFGHERGAFSGADAARPGLLEEAEGGTLFLDEIGELPLELQSALLGVIERRASRRLGGARERRHDVRFVAATNRNLAEEVRQKHFREDLYFRLSAARVHLPPLRDRRDDLRALAQQFAAECGAPLSPEILNAFSQYDWPGNIRELRNAILRLAAEPEGKRSPPATLLGAGELGPMHVARRQAGETFERQYLERALALASGNISRAAELAGISRQFFTKLLARHGLRASDREGQA